MALLVDPHKARWHRILALGPHTLWHVKTCNQGWHELRLRNSTENAPRRSHRLFWSIPEKRFAAGEDSLRALEDHPALMVQIQVRLRKWQPPA